MVKSLLNYEKFTYRIGSNIIGNPNIYAQVKTFVKSTVKSAQSHHPKLDVSPILNGKQLPNRNAIQYIIFTKRNRIQNSRNVTNSNKQITSN